MQKNRDKYKNGDFFIGKLHSYPVGLKPMILAFIPLLWEEEVSFEL